MNSLSRAFVGPASHMSLMMINSRKRNSCFFFFYVKIYSTVNELVIRTNTENKTLYTPLRCLGGKLIYRGKISQVDTFSLYRLSLALLAGKTSEAISYLFCWWRRGWPSQVYL